MILATSATSTNPIEKTSSVILEVLDIRLQADTGKEYRTEQHVGIDIHLSRDIFRILNVAQNNSLRHMPCNICDPKVPLCYVRESQTERKTCNRNPACMRIHTVDFLNTR